MFWKNDGQENPCLLELYVQRGRKLARRDAITRRNLSLLRDVFWPERVAWVDKFLELYFELLDAGETGSDAVELLRGEVGRLRDLQQPGQGHVPANVPPWYTTLETDTVRWFLDKVVPCLSDRGLWLTYTYYEEEMASRQAARASAPHARFDPLGPPASAPDIAALLRARLPIPLKSGLVDDIARRIHDSAQQRYDQYDQDKFHKASRPPPPQQSVPQGGVDAEEVDQGFLAELEAAGDEGPNEAAELRRLMQLQVAARPGQPAPPAPSRGLIITDYFGRAATPPPQSPANDAAAEGEDSWTCPSCTYRHVEAEAGFLACAMCGREKDAVIE